ncbi:MAG: hypothetical protein JSU72_00430 [Deltaproteobacteria bacterium]|nr:MAG: hypothetical protein JSU72_00430 [Deltaproteobacteria bacterium]
MPSKLIEKIPLPNGLVLELWDRSRPMAGDRWLVSLLARMEIPILPEFFSDIHLGEQAYKDLVDTNGDRLVFTQENERHFVDEQETEAILERLCQRLKETLLAYLSSPRFASRYVLKKYGDLQDRHSWGSKPTSNGSTSPS